MKKKINITAYLLLAGWCAYAQTITIVAGTGVAGYSGDGGPATSAKLHLAASYSGGGLEVDTAGNLYISDAANFVIRKVSPSGFITTFAGNGTNGYSGDGGAATAAELNIPNGLGMDASGDLYIVDGGGFVVRKVNPSGTISTFAGNGIAGFSGDGGPATAAQLNYVSAIAFDAAGNAYIADAVNNRIRRVDTFGIITTVDSNCNYPLGVAIDGLGNRYISEFDSFVVKKVSPSGTTGLFAGNYAHGFNGDGASATAKKLGGPTNLATDISGNVYIADPWNRVVRKVDAGGVISTYTGTDTVMGFSGSGGPATAARLNFPSGVAVDRYGNVYVSDILNNVVWRVGNATAAIGQLNETSENLQVYPNPVSNMLTISLANVSNELVRVQIMNVAGTKVMEFSMHSNQQLTLPFNVPDGVYIISAATHLKTVFSKIMKIAEHSQ